MISRMPGCLCSTAQGSFPLSGSFISAPDVARAGPLQGVVWTGAHKASGILDEWELG